MEEKLNILNEEELIKHIVLILENGRKQVLIQTNNIMTFTYFEIGKYIVEFEQQGNDRAKYAKKTLEKLSKQLTEKFGKGFSKDNLERMRRVYKVFQNSATLLRKSDKLLSWSHYLLLCRIDNESERAFYELEAYHQHWSVRELERQFNSALYERLVLSKDKESILKLSKQGQIITEAKDLIKEPYILEFLGLEEKVSFSENELENAIISKIENFMLELGKGFLFEKRQKRITFDEDHYYIDLVLYNRILRCFVLIDLKIGKLKHQDLGQMQMYVNYYDRYVKTEEENSTIGIVLCKDKSETLVEITVT
jgi:predicted nuclease of restriction endonuclease-like (RecB) superfamily